MQKLCVASCRSVSDSITFCLPLFGHIIIFVKCHLAWLLGYKEGIEANSWYERNAPGIFMFYDASKHNHTATELPKTYLEICNIKSCYTWSRPGRNYTSNIALIRSTYMAKDFASIAYCSSLTSTEPNFHYIVRTQTTEVSQDMRTITLSRKRLFHEEIWFLLLEFRDESTCSRAFAL